MGGEPILLRSGRREQWGHSKVAKGHECPLRASDNGGRGRYLLVGAHLGMARGVVLMQSPGVGNCVNMFSYVKNGQYPMLVLVSMRGEFGERNPWQYAAGQAVQPVLEACGFICLKIEKPEDVAETIQAACAMVFRAGQAVAVMLSQRLIGAKVL